MIFQNIKALIDWVGKIHITFPTLFSPGMLFISSFFFGISKFRKVTIVPNNLIAAWSQIPAIPMSQARLESPASVTFRNNSIRKLLPLIFRFMKIT